MIYIRSLSGKDLDVPASEVFTFIGAGGRNPESLGSLVESCIKELSGLITPRLCYSQYDIKIEGNRIDLGFAVTVSADLARNLAGCDGIILVAATVGIGADRAVAKYGHIEPSRAVVMQAAGAAAVETLLDDFCDEMEVSYGTLRPRFSCGYGDLELSLQKNIFKALECEKRIGVTLNSSLLMTPSKSVTAIIGYKKQQK